MKIYTITEHCYLNADGNWPGDDLEALSGTAKSFRRKDSAKQEVVDWIYDTIAEYYCDEEADIEETYQCALKSIQHIPNSTYCHKRNMLVWELQLCGRIYKWSLFEQEI